MPCDYTGNVLLGVVWSVATPSRNSFKILQFIESYIAFYNKLVHSLSLGMRQEIHPDREILTVLPWWYVIWSNLQMNTGLRGPTQPNVPPHNVHIALQQLHCVAPPISIYSTSVAQTKAATDVRTHPHHPRLFDRGGGGWSSITSIHQTRGLKKSKIPKS